MADASHYKVMDWSEIPFCEGYDPESGKLTLRGCDSIPDEVFDFASTHVVKILDASNNADLKTLPDYFAKGLPELERAFFSDCGFDQVPPQLRGCDKLVMLAMKFNGITELPEDILPHSMEWLILTGNKIETLPESMGGLTQLKKVALAGNPLSAGLPETMKNCREIELLRITAGNQQFPTPQWVFELPKLAFFSDGGNPASYAYPDVANDAGDVAWSSLQIKKIIGASPSSTVSSAVLDGQDVAVKVFKAGLASDGRAEDDFMCSLIAGSHKNLREVLGRATGHPEGRDAIVTGLVPQGEYKDLGSPPNFETCTRDTYPENPVFEPWFVKNVLLDVARAMVHLHQQNIAHGDLYAHNIQVNDEGDALVGDFGAATYYDPEAAEAPLRQAQDVRAFGYLIEDLLKRMNFRGTRLDFGAILDDLKEDCTNVDAYARPDFATLQKEIVALQV